MVSLPRGDASTLLPAATVAKLTTARSSAPESAAGLVPRKLKGAALMGRKRAYIAEDQLTSATKRKEEARASEAKRHAAATATPVQKEEVTSRPPATGSASRGLGDQPPEKSAAAAKLTPEVPVLSAPARRPRAPEPPAVLAAIASSALALVPPPPQAARHADHGSSAMPGALEEAFFVLDWLQADLGGADRCIAADRLGLVAGWLQADSSIKTAWGHAEAATKEGRKVAGMATAARDAALADAAAAEKRCRTTETELKALCDEQAARARQLEEQKEKLKTQETALTDRGTELEQAAQEQAMERSRLERLKEEVEAAQASHTKLVSEEKARLEAREKILAAAEKAAAVGRDAFISLKQRSRVALQSLYE
nr:uncharacterized abhydrolase domain-containing protein DDB_G0269086-like [Aegilops tauschii subsp. strangulata]